MRKLWSVLLTAAMTAALLSGCGSSSKQPEVTTAAEKTASETTVAQTKEEASAPESQEKGDEAGGEAKGDNAKSETEQPGGYAAADIKAEPAKSEYRIACLTRGLYHNYHQSIKDGLDAAAKDCGVTYTFQGTENESQVDKQVEMLGTLIDQRPDAIILGPLDSKAVMPEIKRAEEEGIPVIIIDQTIDSDIPISTITTFGHADGGRFMAAKINELFPGPDEVQVAMIASDQYSDYSVQRRDAFIEEIAEKYPQINLVDIQYSDGGDQLKAADGTKAIIEAYPDLKVIIGSGEGNAVGVLNALKETGHEGDYTVLGFDSGKTQQDAIRAGIQLGTEASFPYMIGYEAICVAVKYLNGEEVPKKIDTGYYWVDKNNIDTEEAQLRCYE